MQYMSVPPHQHIETVAPVASVCWLAIEQIKCWRSTEVVCALIRSCKTSLPVHTCVVVLVWGSFSGSRYLPMLTLYPVLSCFRKVHVWPARLPVALRVENSYFILSWFHQYQETHVRTLHCANTKQLRQMFLRFSRKACETLFVLPRRSTIAHRFQSTLDVKVAPARISPR